MNFSWRFLTFAFSVVAIILGACNLHNQVGFGLGMHIASLVILCISAIVAVIEAILLFSIKGWGIPLGIINILVGLLPVFYCISYFKEQPFEGVHILADGLFIMVQIIVSFIFGLKRH